MNKQEIINNISVEHGISKVAAKAIFEQIFEDIIEAIRSTKSDNKIQIPGFGSFSMKKRDARLGRNPKTGDSMEIAAKQVIKFKVSKTLSDKIN